MWTKKTWTWFHFEGTESHVFVTRLNSFMIWKVVRSTPNAQKFHVLIWKARKKTKRVATYRPSRFFPCKREEVKRSIFFAIFPFFADIISTAHKESIFLPKTGSRALQLSNVDSDVFTSTFSKANLGFQSQNDSSSYLKRSFWTLYQGRQRFRIQITINFRGFWREPDSFHWLNIRPLELSLSEAGRKSRTFKSKTFCFVQLVITSRLRLR